MLTREKKEDTNPCLFKCLSQLIIPAKCAAAGALGAAVLTATHHDGYSTAESAKIAAAGNALFFPVFSFLIECVQADMRAISPSFEDIGHEPAGPYQNPLFQFLLDIFGSMIGYGILNSTTDLEMSLGELLNAVSVGELILLLPSVFLLVRTYLCLEKYNSQESAVTFRAEERESKVIEINDDKMKNNKSPQPKPAGATVSASSFFPKLTMIKVAVQPSSTITSTANTDEQQQPGTEYKM